MLDHNVTTYPIQMPPRLYKLVVDIHTASTDYRRYTEGLYTELLEYSDHLPELPSYEELQYQINAQRAAIREQGGRPKISARALTQRLLCRATYHLMGYAPSCEAISPAELTKYIKVGQILTHHPTWITRTSVPKLYKTKDYSNRVEYVKLYSVGLVARAQPYSIFPAVATAMDELLEGAPHTCQSLHTIVQRLASHPFGDTRLDTICDMIRRDIITYALASTTFTITPRTLANIIHRNIKAAAH